MAQFNFRATSGYVTDAEGETYVLAEAYPTVRDTHSFGYDNITGISTRDRDSGVSSEYAGEHFISNNEAFSRTFIYACGNGDFNVGLCAGPHIGNGDQQISLVALNDSNVEQRTIATIASGQSTSKYDANGAAHATFADWAANSTTLSVTLAGNETRIGVKMGAGDGTTAYTTHINHFSVESAATPATILNIDGDNDVQVGQENAAIETSGVSLTSAIQTILFGGEPLTIRNWGGTVVQQLMLSLSGAGRVGFYVDYSERATVGTHTFYVARTHGSTGAITVDYATSGDAHTAASGTLAWGDGDLSIKSFSVSVDSKSAGDHRIVATLSNPTGGAALHNGDNTVAYGLIDDNTIASSNAIFIDADAGVDGSGTEGSPYNNWYSARAAVTGTTKYIYVKGMMVPDGTDSSAMSQTVKHLAIANTFEGRTSEAERLVIRSWPGFTGGVDGGLQTDVAGFAADAAAGGATGNMNYITLRKLSFTNLDTSSQDSVGGKCYALRLRSLTHTTDHWTVEGCTVNGVACAANAATAVIFSEGNANTTGLKLWRNTFTDCQHTNKVERLNVLEVYRHSDVSIQRCTVATDAGDIYEKEGQQRVGAIGLSSKFNQLNAARIRMSSQSTYDLQNYYIVQGNVFDSPLGDFQQMPIQVDHSGTNGGATGLWFVGNQINNYSFSTYGALNIEDAAFDGAVIFNNYFNAVTRPIRFDSGVSDPAYMDYNVYNSGSLEFVLSGGTQTSLTAFQGATSFETNAVSGTTLVGSGVSGSDAGTQLTGIEVVGAA